MKIFDLFKKKVSNGITGSIVLSFLLYIVMVGLALWIGLSFTKKYGTLPADTPAVLSNMFVWSATLIAPIVAIILINSWRHQKNFEANFELLNASEENLIRFKNKIFPICQTVIKIHEIGSQDQTYFLAHSLFRHPLEISNQCLDDFYLNMERYLNYNENPELKRMMNEYYGIATDFLYINKEIIDDYYGHIYYQLKTLSSNEGWVDSRLTIVLSEDSPRLREIKRKYLSFNTRYEHIGMNMEFDEGTGEMKPVQKTYKQYYELMDSFYKQINTKIKEINRA